MPRKKNQRSQVPLARGVPPIHRHALKHNHSDGTPISREDIQSAWWQRIYASPVDPEYPTGHRVLVGTAVNGSLLEIGVANYGSDDERIVHALLLREKFKRLMDRDIPGWRARWKPARSSAVRVSRTD